MLHIRPFDWLRERRHTQLVPVTVPPSCRYHRALRLALGAEAKLNLTRGLYRNLVAYTRTSTGSRCGRTAELAPVAVPQSRRTYAHFDWLRGRGTLNLHLWLYRNLAAHTRTSTGSGSGCQTELDTGAAPQSRFTTAPFDWLWGRRQTQFDPGLYRHLAAHTYPSTGSGGGGTLNLTRGMQRHLAAHTYPSTGSGGGGTLNLTRGMQRHRAASSSECQFIYFWSFWRISTRRIFPLIVFGSSSTNSIRRGIL